MANPVWLKKYLTMKPEVTKVFNDLEEFHDFCRFEMLPFNEANLYNRASPIWNQFYASKNPRKSRAPKKVD